jgi:hypothetical protein
MPDDLDMRDVGEVLRRGVLPVTRALFQPGELTGIDVYLVGRPEDYDPPYGAEVHVRVTDIEGNAWTCKAGVFTAELQSAEDLAYWLSEAIENDISVAMPGASNAHSTARCRAYSASDERRRLRPLRGRPVIGRAARSRDSVCSNRTHRSGSGADGARRLNTPSETGTYARRASWCRR